MDRGAYLHRFRWPTSVLDENEMANAILKCASDQISEGTALYLDGELTAVCRDGTAACRAT